MGEEETVMRYLWLVVILVVGVTLIVLAYRWSGSTSRRLTATSERLNQKYRCIIANGRSLRGATTDDCRHYYPNSVR